MCNWKDMGHPAAGGAEVYVDAITAHWAEWGHDVTIFCARAPGQLPEDGAGAVRVVRRGGRFTVYREAHRWYRQEGAGRFDVVLDVVNTRPFLMPTYVRDAPVVAMIFQVAREVWAYEVPWPAALLGRHVLEPRWLRRYADVPTLTISESSRESLRSYGLQDVAVVPVGLHGLPVTTPPERELVPTVAFLGRLAANKRPDHALEAFRRARRRIPEARMWVVGSGPMEGRLRRQFADEPVRFFGRVPEEEKLNLLARAHAVVVTSVREGWGLVVTEAATVGTPSIGYDVAGLRDSLRASNGIVVGASIDDLADSLASVLGAWASGGAPAVAPGGAALWSDVAQQVLAHLQQDRCHGR